MVLCAECNSEMPKVPQWLSDVKVQFICDACRQKHPRHWVSPEDLEPIIMAEEKQEEEQMEVPFSQIAKELIGEGDEEEGEFGFYALEESDADEME